MALLELDDLTAYITDVPVVRGIDLAVEEGEIVSLAGPNGAGKTTTFRAIVGLADRTQGAIRFHGEDISGLPAHQRKRRNLGFCPQERRMFTRLTARENVMMSLWGGEDDLDVETQLDSVLEVFPAMEAFLDREAGNLSGGEQQMVAISRALVSDPDLLLLDEPFEGLAPSIRADVREACQRIRDEFDTSVLIAESHVDNVGDMAERTYVIDRGEIVAEGTTEELFENDAVVNLFEG